MNPKDVWIIRCVINSCESIWACYCWYITHKSLTMVPIWVQLQWIAYPKNTLHGGGILDFLGLRLSIFGQNPRGEESWKGQRQRPEVSAGQLLPTSSARERLGVWEDLARAKTDQNPTSPHALGFFFPFPPSTFLTLCRPT